MASGVDGTLALLYRDISASFPLLCVKSLNDCSVPLQLYRPIEIRSSVIQKQFIFQENLNAGAKNTNKK